MSDEERFEKIAEHANHLQHGIEDACFTPMEVIEILNDIGKLAKSKY